MVESRYCLNCGVELSATAKFCNQCGTKVVPLVQQPPAVQPQVPEIPQPVQRTPDYDEGPGKVDPGRAAPAAVEATPPEEKERGGCLRAFLILAVVANLAFGVLTLLASGDLEGIFLFSAILNFAGAGFAIAIWFWKRWGVYGYIAMIGISSLLNLSMEEYTAAAQGLIPMLILIGLVRPVWEHME